MTTKNKKKDPLGGLHSIDEKMGSIRERIYEDLMQAPKFSSLHPDFLNRMAAWAAPRYKSYKEALQAAKRKIHQVFGMYLKDDRSIRQAGKLIDQLSSSSSEEEVHSVCRKILSMHSSSNERLGQIEHYFFSSIWSITGSPEHVLDLACGFNPFTLPWMGLTKNACYQAMDVDRSMIVLISAFLSKYSLNAGTVWVDIVENPPAMPTDVALFLKSFPCFEQQEKNSGFTILNSLKAKWVVLSFPILTLGGKNVGMQTSYAKVADELIMRLNVESESFQIGSELVYVIDMRKNIKL